MDKLGFVWPDLDEDEIHRGSDLLRRFGSDLESTLVAMDRQLNSGLLEASTSQAALSAADAWTQNRSQNLQQILDMVDPAATGVDIFGHAVMRC